MGDKEAIQPDTEPSGAWPEHPDGRWDSGKYRLRAQEDKPPGEVPVRVPGSTFPYDQEAQEVADERQGIPSPVTQAWAEEADARLAATQEWAESKVRAAAERRLKVGEAGALAELERRNLLEALERERADRKREQTEWADQVERERANRDEWRERALAAEARLAELEAGDE